MIYVHLYILKIFIIDLDTLNWYNIGRIYLCFSLEYFCWADWNIGMWVQFMKYTKMILNHIHSKYISKYMFWGSIQNIKIEKFC